MRIQRSAVTFDVDWAPDWAIALCADLCARHQVPATIFVTHPSDVVSDIGRREEFELGIHPNFLPGSTHGNSHLAILDHCLELVPSARAMRTHSLVQSSQLLALISDRYPQIETDTSVLLFGHEGLQPVDVYCGSSRRRLTRLPYNWEDDVAADHPHWQWDSEEPNPAGMAIFDFHPIHVALNTASMSQYEELRSSLNGRDLSQATEKDVEPFVGRGLGARTFLESLLKSKTHQFMVVSDLTALHRSGD